MRTFPPSLRAPGIRPPQAETPQINLEMPARALLRRRLHDQAPERLQRLILEVPARVSPEVSPSRETPRLSRASAHVLALVVRPLDRAIDALPHGRAVETTSLGAGAVTAGKAMLHLARGRGDEHGIRGRTDGAEDTENQHSNRQFAARHAPDALLRDAEETIAKSDSRASLANRVERRGERKNARGRRAFSR